MVRLISARRWPLIAAFLAAVLAAGFMVTSHGQPARGQTSPIHTVQASTGHVAAGKVLKAQVRTRPFLPNARQKAAQHKILNLPAAPIGPRPAASSVRKLTGPQTTVAGAARAGPSPLAATSLTFFKKTTPGASCATSCGQSAINEPDTASAGKVILQTSNWDIAYTTNAGAKSPTWLYQNPYSLDSGFCCDQTVTYVPSRNMLVREALDLGTGAVQGFDIAIATPQAPATWCTYHFSAASFGGTAGDLLDYPKIAYADNNLYVTWNHYNPAGSTWIDTGLARFPLDSLKSCAGFSFNYVTRSDTFTFGLSYGDSSLDTFYWVSDWYTQGAGSGTSERIYYWPENSGTYFFQDIGVTSYNFAGGSCASQDGVVTNWCSRLDPRWETASISRAPYAANAGLTGFAGDETLTVTITAGPGGGDPFPYVIYEYFKLNALSFIQTSSTFNDGYAFAYGGCSPDSNGDLGCAATYGGGTGSAHYYPAGITIVQDDVSPAQPWAYSFNQTGAGNATAWGDYEITQPWNPSIGLWVTTEWYLSSNGVVHPQVLIFGRGRDAGGYGKWKNS